MSDHDHHHNEDSKNPLASLVGMIFLLLVPFSLIIMLGFVGAAFIKGGGYVEAPPEPVKSSSPSPSSSGTALAGGPVSEEQMALGKTAFATCGACHGLDGKGLQVGPQKMAPSFEGSKLLLGNPDASIVAVLKGIEKAPGNAYLGQMMALGAGMDDKSVAAVLTYVRNSFGNSASAISAEQVAAMRAKYAATNAPMGLPRTDLEKLAEGK